MEELGDRRVRTERQVNSVSQQATAGDRLTTVTFTNTLTASGSMSIQDPKMAVTNKNIIPIPNCIKTIRRSWYMPVP